MVGQQYKKEVMSCTLYVMLCGTLFFGVAQVEAMQLAENVLDSSAASAVDVLFDALKKDSLASLGFNKDLQHVMARYILHNNPIVGFIQEKLVSELCLCDLCIDREVSCVKFCPTGDQVVVTSTGGAVELWDADSGKSIQKFKGHLRVVHTADFDTTGQKIVTVSKDNSIIVWDTSSEEKLKSFFDFDFNDGCANDPQSAMFNRTADKVLISSSYGTEVKVWDIFLDTCTLILNDLVVHRNPPCFSGSGTKIIGVTDNYLGVWDSRSGQLLYKLLDLNGNTQNVSFCVSADKVAALSEGVITIFDSELGKTLHTFAGHDDVSFVKLTRSGDRLLSASKDGIVMLWDTNSGKVISRLFGKKYTWRTKFFVRKNRVVGVYDNGEVMVWDTFTGEQAQIFLGNDYSFSRIDLDVSGERLITDTTRRVTDGTSMCGTAKMWNLERLYICSAWLQGDHSLEESLVLELVYKGIITYSQLSHRDLTARGKFDINEYPHLQVVYDGMPSEIQKILEPFVVKVNKA